MTTAPTIELGHFASEAELRNLLALFGFPLQGYTTIARIPQFNDSIENIKLRLELGSACHLCGGAHTDTILARIYYDTRRSVYCLKAHHQRDKKCRKDYTITATVEVANQRRFEKSDQVPPSEAARVGRLFESAGVRTEPGNLKIWKLPAPAAPGFTAHVMLVGEDAWRMLMTAADPSGGSDATWWRSSKYPGLKHEFLQQDLWTPGRVGYRAVPRPPFWPLRINEA